MEKKLVVILALLAFILPPTGSAATINVPADQSTIQAAITAATGGDVIMIVAGTYDEQLVIDKQLTISGADQATVIIQPSTAPATGVYDISFTVGSSGSTIQTLTLDFNGSADDRSGNGLVVSDLDGPAVTGLTVQNLTIYTGDANTGIQTGKNADVSNLLIDNLTIVGDDSGSGEGIYINPGPGTDIMVSNCTINGNLYAGVSIESSSVTVTGNTIGNTSGTGANAGVRFIDLAVSGQSYSDVVITQNIISQMTYGIRANASNSGGSLIISATENLITNCTTGFVAGTSADVTLNQNSIDSSNTTLISNTSGNTLDASGNWLGSSDPSTVAGSLTNPSLIDFTPLLTSGSDSDAGTTGFQPDLSDLLVHTLGGQAGSVSRPQEGINIVVN